MPRWRSWWWPRSDRGQATLSYISALLVAGVVVSAATAAATGNQEQVTRAMNCAVHKVISLAQEACTPGTAGPGRPGDPGGTGGAGGTGGTGGTGGGQGGQPTSCDDVIYTDSTAGGTPAGASDFSRQVRVNCIWYPVNPECAALAAIPNWQAGLTVPADQPDAAKKLADCVTAGVGPPSKNPDDARCNKTTIMNGTVTADPPRAQVGCTEWVVPIECKDAWQAWQGLPQNASPGDRYQTGSRLQSCMETFYTQNETTCSVKQDTVTEKWEITLLFFLKIQGSNGVMVEQLGDGRWRVHVLDETQVGGDFSKEVHSAEFGLLAMTGWGSDKTFEFGDQASAEKWVEWYKDYASTAKEIERAQRPNCPHGECYVNPFTIKHMKQLMQTEPKRKKLSEAQGRSTTVSVKGGYNPTGGGGVGGNASWKGEGTSENRYMQDGTRSSTLTMSDEGAVNLLAKLSKKNKKPGDKPDDPKVDGDLAAKLKEALGTSAKGKVSLTAVYNKDGSLAKVILGIDQSFLNTLSKVDPEVAVKLPAGFSVEAGFTYQVDEGESTIRENVIDVGTHEDLRPGLEATMSEIFPQDKNGKFSSKAPSLDFDTGGIGDLVDTVGTTRNLKYDTKVQEIGGHAGVFFAGMPLIDVKGGKITEGRDLTGSSLDVIDVNGNKATMTPSPKCKDKQINPDTYGYDQGPPYADRDYPY